MKVLIPPSEGKTNIKKPMDIKFGETDFKYTLFAENRFYGEDRLNDAKQLTLEDMKKSKVNFDHVACVSCGTCGVIGPKSSIIFNHERSGHGVKFKYG